MVSLQHFLRVKVFPDDIFLYILFSGTSYVSSFGCDDLNGLLTLATRTHFSLETR